MFDPSAKIAAKVEALSEALNALSSGETITYARLSKIAGERVGGGSYVLQRALKSAEEKSGAIYDNVHGKGYQRLETKDVPGVGKKANGRIRRVARRTRKRLEGIRANDMSTKEVASIAAYRSHFGMIEGLARERTVEAIAGGLEKATAIPALAIAERLAVLMGGKK